MLLATPVYRGTFTGALKNLLDLLPVEALQGKAVAIAAMGATDHHHLGADWHLRDALAWFGALLLPTSVYLTSADCGGREIVAGRTLRSLLLERAAPRGRDGQSRTGSSVVAETAQLARL